MDIIKKATEIIETEGYYIKHKIMPFALFRNHEIEYDEIKSFIRMDSNDKYDTDKIFINFYVSVCRTGSEILSSDKNRQLANYLLHMCDVVDELNAMKIEIHRDLRELEL